MTEKTLYAPRLFARLIDLALVSISIAVIEVFFKTVDFNMLLCFWCYNIVVIAFKGKTLGKYSLGLAVQTRSTGIRKIFLLIARELLFLLLMPLLFLNLLTMSTSALHDRILRTKVVRDDV